MAKYVITNKDGTQQIQELDDESASYISNKYPDRIARYEREQPIIILNAKDQSIVPTTVPNKEIAAAGLAADAKNRGLIDANGLPYAEQSRLPTETYSEFGSAARGMLDGAAFGFDDEIYGAVTAPFSDKTYTDKRDESRREKEAAREQHPGYYLGGAVAGGVATGVVGGAAFGAARGALAARGAGAGIIAGSEAANAANTANAVTNAGRAAKIAKALGRGAATGAASGAVAGAGNAPTLSDVPFEAVKGAGIGAAAGAIFSGVRPVLGAVLSTRPTLIKFFLDKVNYNPLEKIQKIFSGRNFQQGFDSGILEAETELATLQSLQKQGVTAMSQADKAALEKSIAELRKAIDAKKLDVNNAMGFEEAGKTATSNMAPKDAAIAAAERKIAKIEKQLKNYRGSDEASVAQRRILNTAKEEANKELSAAKKMMPTTVVDTEAAKQKIADIEKQLEKLRGSDPASIEKRAALNAAKLKAQEELNIADDLPAEIITDSEGAINLLNNRSVGNEVARGTWTETKKGIVAGLSGDAATYAAAANGGPLPDVIMDGVGVLGAGGEKRLQASGWSAEKIKEIQNKVKAAQAILNNPDSTDEEYSAALASWSNLSKQIADSEAKPANRTAAVADGQVTSDDNSAGVATAQARMSAAEKMMDNNELTDEQYTAALAEWTAASEQLKQLSGKK